MIRRYRGLTAANSPSLVTSSSCLTIEDLLATATEARDAAQAVVDAASSDSWWRPTWLVAMMDAAEAAVFGGDYDARLHQWLLVMLVAILVALVAILGSDEAGCGR